MLSIFIQFTPAIKWSPFTALFSWLGGLFTKPIMEQITFLKSEIQEVKVQQLTNEKNRIRFEVLHFANSCRNHVKHTKDEFQHIVDLNDAYEKLLKETDDANGVFTEEYKYILKLYHKCQEENSFLA